MRSHARFVIMRVEIASSSRVTPANAAIFSWFAIRQSYTAAGTGDHSTPAYRPSVFSRKMTRSTSSR